MCYGNRMDTVARPTRELPEGIDEPRVIRSRLLRATLAVFGTIFLGLGVLGVVLPLLPATPFFLLSAACYARASRSLYVWLLNLPGVGPTIVRWKTTRTVAPNARAAAVALVWLAFIPSVFFAPLLPVKLGLALGGAIITALVLRLPTTAPALEPAGPE